MQAPGLPITKVTLDIDSSASDAKEWRASQKWQQQGRGWQHWQQNALSHSHFIRNVHAGIWDMGGEEVASLLNHYCCVIWGFSPGSFALSMILWVFKYLLSKFLFHVTHLMLLVPRNHDL